jgi:hypothetical protein
MTFTGAKQPTPGRAEYWLLRSPDRRLGDVGGEIGHRTPQPHQLRVGTFTIAHRYA